MKTCNYCQKQKLEDEFEMLVDYGYRRFTCNTCMQDYRDMLKKHAEKKKCKNDGKLIHVEHETLLNQLLDDTYHTPSTS